MNHAAHEIGTQAASGSLAADAVFAFECALELGVEFFDRDRGQEAEPAKVDGKQWDVAAGDGAGGGKQRSVAAQHDDQVAAVGHVVARHRRLARRIGRGGFIGAHRQAAAVQPRQQFRHDLLGLPDLRLGDDSEVPDRTHTAGTLCCLPCP